MILRRRSRWAWRWYAAVLSLAVVLAGCAARQPTGSSSATVDAASRFEREWARVAAAPPELRIQLSARPLAFFRFVNQAWTHEVCEAFADESGRLPLARLHGDAHVEQYAVTAGARGLDDFDDSARGPAVVDLVRFLGSLELAAAQRGWEAALPEAIDAFFAGYRRALEDPSYLPPDPAVVARMRAIPAQTRLEFLAWADSLMEPLTAGQRQQLALSWPKVEAFAAQDNPEATSAFLARKAVGWFHLGIGSALTPKLLIRVEGPSADPHDDLVLEAKEVGAFEGSTCVSIPSQTEAFRVVEGIRQIGRLPQRLLVAMPGLSGTRPDGRGWWVKAWDRTFVEVAVADLASPAELRDVAHDVGAQLGSSNLAPPSGLPGDDARRVELDAVTRLEPRIRQVAHDLTVALIDAWSRGR